MASRRPPLFELLQQQDGPRQGRGSNAGNPGPLGSPPTAPKPPAQGQAQGAVETKPNGSAKPSTLEDLSEPAAKPKTGAPSATPPASKPGVLPLGKPKAKPEPKPEARAERAPKPSADPAPERPNGAADWSGMHPKSSVRVKMVWIYGGAAAVIAVVVVAWVFSYSLAESKWKAQFESHLQKSEGSGPIQDPIQDPIRDPIAVSQNDPSRSTPPPLSGIERQESPSEAARRSPVEPERPAVEPQPAPARTIDVLVDVREAGNNYLKLASGMTRQRAVGLAQHLTASGVQAMAIEEGRDSFGLYTAFAVPSGQYRSMGEQRRDLEARVVRLLGSTPAELGGPYTPRDQIWMRFDG